MKKMSKFFAFLFVICMLAGMLPMTALAATEYDLWVGGIRVTSENASNILNAVDTDGNPSAVYDPETGTLTLTNDAPNITGLHENALIYSHGIDLTINAPNGLTLSTSATGSYGVYAEEGNLTITGDVTVSSTQTNIYAYDGTLTINGDAIVSGAKYGLESRGDITVNGNVDATSINNAVYSSRGAVKISGDAAAKSTTTSSTAWAIFGKTGIEVGGSVVAESAQGTAVYSDDGAVKVVSGTWDMKGTSRAVSAASGITIPDTHQITEPSEGSISKIINGNISYYTVTESDGTTVAKHAVIEPIIEQTYTITLTTGDNGTAEVSRVTAPEGAEVTVTADPAAGYQIDKITYTPEGGAETDITSTAKFTMPAKNVTVKVTFKDLSPWKKLQAQMAAGVENITLTGDVVAESDDTVLAVPSGKTVTLDLAGYKIDRALNGEDADPVTNGNVINVKGALTINDSAGTGIITGGNNAGSSGGVYVDGSDASLTLNGGKITGNRCTVRGGGVGVYAESTFKMTDGEISGNYAREHGSGVYVRDSVFTLSGGKITGNESGSSYGSGVGFYHGGLTAPAFNISGDPVVCGNTNVNDVEYNVRFTSANLAKATVAGNLTEGAKIGVRLDSDIKNDPFTTGLNGNDENGYGDESFFFSDDPDYTVVLTEASGDLPGGEAILARVYAVTVSDTTGGTVDVDPEKALPGTEITVAIAPKAGYDIDSATYSYTQAGATEPTVSNLILENGIATFSLPAADVTVNVTFKALAAPMTVTEPENGTVTYLPEAPVTDDTVTVTAQPSDGYRIGTITVKDKNNNDVAYSITDTGFTFTAPAGGATVTVTFTNVPYTITVAESENGTVTVDKSSAYINETITITSINPLVGYELDTIGYTKDTDDTLVPITGDTFNMPAANITIKAVFKELPPWKKLQAEMAAMGEDYENITLTQDVIAEADDTMLQVPDGKTVTLDLAGFTINRNKDTDASAGLVIYVRDGGKLIINDTSENGTGTITGGNCTGEGGGIRVNGTLEMNGGTITGNNATKKGGGLYVAGGTVTLNDGAVISENEAADGGGIYITGAGKVTMNGGEISSNTSTTDGGGIKLSGENATVTINGGSITENKSAYGAGLHVNQGTLTFNDGKISKNEAAENAGGVGVYNGGTFEMYDGEISGNKARACSGVYIANAGGITFNLSGGKITGNESASTDDECSGGVSFKDGDSIFKLSGGPVISGNTADGEEMNVNMNRLSAITIADELSEDAEIGVTLREENAGKPFTSGLNGKGNETNFFSDDQDYVVTLNPDGEAILGWILTITKNWSDFNNSYRLRPEDLTVTVMAKTSSGGETEYTTEAEGWVKSGNIWTYELAVPVNNETITVWETIPDDYKIGLGSIDHPITAAVEKDMGVALTNLISLPHKIDIEDPENGTVEANKEEAYEGSLITITVTPDEGYDVDKVTVTDEAGNELRVRDNGDGTYTFVMPDARVSVNVTFKETDGGDEPEHDCPSKNFKDFDPNAWYHEAVDYAVVNGLMKGTSPTTFEPGTATTRAMIVTILWRLEGEPVVNAVNPFEDVENGAWYTDAIVWAAENGIVEGYGNGNFGPNDDITREQLVTMLWRYAKYKGYDVSVGENTNILSYDDALDISKWAMPAMQWACGADIINGRTQSTIAPQGLANRAETAAIFMRFLKDLD